MNNLYQTIKTLQSISGKNAKLEYLMSQKDNVQLRDYLKAVYDPSINYYQKKISTSVPPFAVLENDFSFVLDSLKPLTMREISGKAAKDYLNELNARISKESKELLDLLLKRSINAGVSDSTLLKVWEDLYFIPKYQRCSGLDDKAISKFSKQKEFIVQKKLDGSFCYLVNDNGDLDAITRSGNKYSKEFAKLLFSNNVFELKNRVVIGELEVFKDGKVLDRKTGNGILNSILQSGEIDPQYEYRLTAWDMIGVDDFKSGSCSLPYFTRLQYLKPLWQNVVEMHYVTSLEEAYKINSKFLQDGCEGSVIKTTDFYWKDGTSKDCVKLKVKFQVDLEIIEVEEGKGKYKGMLGALTVASKDRKIITDVGTGLSDEDRVNLWKDKESLLGKIVTIEGNDIISNRVNKDVKSIFLPVLIEMRLDKTEADTEQRCINQLQSVIKGE